MLSDKLTPFINRYNELSDLLSSPDITSDIKKMTELSKEQSSLLPIVEKAKEYKSLISDIADTKEMLSDPEMGEMAKEELKELEPQKPL
ncbi:MAG: PCRF domain-containing protein, partial [Sulfurimonas sp.]|nr:PCRF domain-containing protein [Sulfurimonas sp.]